MTGVRGLLACPACRGDLSADWRCLGCGRRFDAPDGIPDLRLPGDARTEKVRAFYEAAPFPGYPARDSLATFRARAGRSRFAELLDRAIPGDARIAEVGCGTGQMSLFLATADRLVVAADLSRASLRLGAAAARRFGLPRVHFVETDLQRSALRRGAFDVVYTSGVLHHTPDPRAAFAAVARLARPGGIVIAGVYNLLARRLDSDGPSHEPSAFAWCRSIPCCASAPASPPGAPPGSAINTSTLKNTATAWPRSDGGSPRTAWTTSDRFPARCSTKTRRI